MDVVGQRFLAIDILAAAQRRERRDGVPVVRGGNADRVNILAVDDLTKIIVGRAVLVPVALIHLLLGVVAAGGIHIADREHPCLLSEEIAQQPARLRAHADEAHREQIARSGVCSPDFGWKKERHCRAQH